MFEAIVIILIILWLLGWVTSYTLGGFIHILLIIAIVAILVRVIQGGAYERRRGKNRPDYGRDREQDVKAADGVAAKQDEKS